MEGITGGNLSGPWDQGFWFVVPGPWRSKSNFRRFGKRGSGGGSSNWDELQSFEDKVAVLARSHLPDGWEIGVPGSPVASRPGVVAFAYVESLLDVSNLSKSYLDALENIVFLTDAVVRHCSCMGVRVPGEGVGVVGLARITAGAGHDAVLAAGRKLAEQTLAAWRMPR